MGKVAILLLFASLAFAQYFPPVSSGGGGGGSSTPCGSNTQVQYNNAGACGASPNLTFDNSTGTLAVGGQISFAGPTGYATLGNSLIIGPNDVPGWVWTDSDRAISVLTVEKNFTAALGANVTLVAQTMIAQSDPVSFGANTYSLFGLNALALTAGGAPYYTVKGASNYVEHLGSGIAQYIMGTEGVVYNDGIGTAVNLVGGYFESFTYASSTTTNSIGVQIELIGSPNTAVNAYGLRVADVAVGANNWAIKTGAGKIELGALIATGAATGKTVVCADANGQLYRSTSGVACAN